MTASRYTKTSHILVRSLSVCGCCCLNDDVPLLHRRRSRPGSLGFHVVTKFPCFTSTSSDCTHFKLVLVPRQTNKKHILVSRRRICKSPKCEEYGVPRCDCQCVWEGAEFGNRGRKEQTQYRFNICVKAYALALLLSLFHSRKRNHPVVVPTTWRQPFPQQEILPRKIILLASTRPRGNSILAAP